MTLPRPGESKQALSILDIEIINSTDQYVAIKDLVELFGYVDTSHIHELMKNLGIPRYRIPNRGKGRCGRYLYAIRLGDAKRIYAIRRGEIENVIKPENLVEVLER